MKKISGFILTAFTLVFALNLTIFAAAVSDVGMYGESSFTTRPGDSIDIEYFIENAGSSQITNVNIRAACSTAIAHADSTTLTLEPGEIKSFLVRVSTDDSDGDTSHSVSLTASYTNNGASGVTYSQFTVKTKTATTPTSSPASSGKPYLIMTSPSGIIAANADGAVTIPVIFKNAGNDTAKETTFQTVPNESLSINFLEGSNSVTSISKNGTHTVKVSVKPLTTIASGSYPAEISFVYYDLDGTQFTGTAKFYVKVTNNNPVSTDKPIPTLVLDNFSSSSQIITSGSKFSINATVKNSSSTAASNVQVSLKNLSRETIGMSNNVSNKYLNSLAAGTSQNVSFELISYSELENGSYPVTFALTYSDASGNTYETEYTYYVNIVSANTSTSSKGVVEVVSISEPSGVFAPNATAKITVTVKNTGSQTVSELIVKATSPDGIVPKSADSKQIQKLAAGETATLSFSFSPTDKADTQTHTVGFSFDYKNGVKDSTGTLGTESFTQYVGINVSNPDKEDEEEDKPKSTPKIIVNKYEVNPIIVQAGHEFDLDVQFLNTHSVKSVENIKVSFEVKETTLAKGNVFSPVNASNTHFIEKIEPKETSDYHIRFYTVPDASPKNYIITITFEYEDSEGNQYTSIEQIGVNVKQVTKLDVGEYFAPTEVYAQQPFGISFQIHNTGKVVLNNLKIVSMGDAFYTVGSDIIYGNFESGQSDYYDVTIVPNEPGEHTFEVVITYDDDMGESHQIINEYTANVMEAPIYDQPIYEEGKEGMNNGEEMPAEGIMGFIQQHLVWVIIGSVAVVAAVIVVIVVIVKKKKKGFDLDE